MLEDHIQLFYDMLLSCYNICGWKFDSNLQVTYTNSELPNLHKVLLLGRGRDAEILEHGAKSDAPMIISDNMGLMWGVVEKRENTQDRAQDRAPDRARDQGGDFYVLGPILNTDPDIRMLESLVAPFDLSPQNRRDLIFDLTLLPSISTVVFFQQVIMLHYYVNRQKTRISHFDYDTPRQEHAQKIVLDEDVPHVMPFMERKLLDMVRTGNLEYRTTLAEAGAASPGIRVRSTDPVQQAKYSVVAFITLCTRAAIEGGLSSEIAYTLSDTYTQSVDAAQSVSQVAAISHTMYDDFIRRVNLVRRTRGISRPVRICCDYIDTHPESELTLQFLADKVGYTENYLARKFKSEMGMPLSAYVRKARIYRAKTLLSATNLGIYDIAERLHFCSWSYFSESFRKEVDMTPSEYRESMIST